MSLARPRISTAAVLTAGVMVGWLLATLTRPTGTLRAAGTDRWDDRIVAAGPVTVRYDDRLKTALTQDALYYLDYKGGRLLGTVPMYQQTGTTTRMIDTFAERDLVADFKLDVEGGPRPHFVMTTCQLGTYSLGWAPLFVFETETNQVATYRIQQQATATSTKPIFELVELRALPPAQASAH
jgi:hypothetical protein